MSPIRIAPPNPRRIQKPQYEEVTEESTTYYQPVTQQKTMKSNEYLFVVLFSIQCLLVIATLIIGYLMYNKQTDIQLEMKLGVSEEPQKEVWIRQ